MMIKIMKAIFTYNPFCHIGFYFKVFHLHIKKIYSFLLSLLKIVPLFHN